MDAHVKSTALVDHLDTQTDEALHDVIMRARQILAARDSERKKAALAEIQRIAKQHGLDVTVKKPARKRGRPAKQATA